MGDDRESFSKQHVHEDETRCKDLWRFMGLVNNLSSCSQRERGLDVIDGIRADLRP